MSKLQQTQQLQELFHYFPSAEHDGIAPQLKEMMDNVEEILCLSRTQAAADCTGYHGIVDWAEVSFPMSSIQTLWIKIHVQRMSTTHEHLLTTLAQVAFVGAGLTYGAIFRQVVASAYRP